MSAVFNLVRSLDRNARRWPDRLAVVAGAERVSHRELNERVASVASGLASVGVCPGEVVALLLPNGMEFLETALAANSLGAVFLPLNLRLAPLEWTYILGHAGATGLVVDASVTSDVSQLRESCPTLKTVVGVGSVTGADRAYGDWQAPASSSYAPPFPADSSTVSRLMYTSGTTALPKGVPLTHGNVAWKIFDHMLELGLTLEDRTLVAGPMYHVGAYDLPGMGTLYVGGSVVLLPRADPRLILETIAKETITNLWLAPAMLNAIIQLPDATSYDTSSVRFVTNGGEKMPVSLIERFTEVFTGAWLADSFGMTETASGDTFLDPEHTLSKLGSVGRPVMHLDVKIVGDDDRPVGPDETGELLLRGPKVFGGYWRDEEATALAFSDGWFRTGDIAHQDADGYLYIDDRKKDMIVSGGENIASPEVERVLYAHPAVLEAAVVALADERWGEVPKAVVVLKPDRKVTEAELIDHCRTYLARFKVPKVIEFVEELPRTATGKVIKRALRS